MHIIDAMDVVTSNYLALARKYRPQTFDELVGQEPVVTTLRNSFESGRLPHAYMLHGVRGTGKTTTARILARALNYESKDGSKDGPTTDLSQLGIHCADIMASRHVDVIEMDAASNNGVDNIREINDTVVYRPVSARFRVYIIDEVHMLSISAFNALLKTLEEPPPHVKFIFATTELRKIPVTILSRCQRYFLRRVSPEVLSVRLQEIALREQAEIDNEALMLIARAGEGSVRDAISLLDQMISFAGAEPISAKQVAQIVGLADFGKVIDLFGHIKAGRTREVLNLLDSLYMDGADAISVLTELSNFCSRVLRAKFQVERDSSVAISPYEKEKTYELAAQISGRDLSVTWQMLLKGHEDLARAPEPFAALEMLLATVSQFFALTQSQTAALASKVEDSTVAVEPSNARSGTVETPMASEIAEGGSSKVELPKIQKKNAEPVAKITPPIVEVAAPIAKMVEPVAPAPDTPQSGSGEREKTTEENHKPQNDTPQNDAPKTEQPTVITSWEELVEEANTRREAIIVSYLTSNARLGNFYSDKREVSLNEIAPVMGSDQDGKTLVGNFLREVTADAWHVRLDNSIETLSIAEKKTQKATKNHERKLADPLVVKARKLFPHAKILDD